MNEVRSFKDRWDWVTTYMVVIDRFVHHILMMMDKVETNTVPFMSVEVKPLRITLLYNKENLEKMKDSEICFILTHEVYHVVLHHCTTRRPKIGTFEDLVHGYAADMAINCLIPTDKKYRTFPIDKDGNKMGLLPADYKYPDKLSMEQYFKLLKEDINKEEQEKRYDSPNERYDSPNEGDSDSGNIADDITRGIKRIDSHDLWKEENIIGEMIRNKIRQVMSKDKVWGSLSSDLQAIIAAAQETYVSWERYLKHHIGNLISPTYTRTITKPDKRFGYPYLGKKRGYSDRKLVAIDTSGSISEENLMQFLAEINKLVEIIPVDLILFDAEITLGPIQYNKKHISFDFKGREGTNFAPAFKLAEEKHYQSVIILTDGDAPAIPYPIGVKDVLWVLTKKSCDPPVDWGVRIHIDE